MLPTSTGPSMWDCITNAYFHGVRVGLGGVRDVRELCFESYGRDILRAAYLNWTANVRWGLGRS